MEIQQPGKYFLILIPSSNVFFKYALLVQLDKKLRQNFERYMRLLIFFARNFDSGYALYSMYVCIYSNTAGGKSISPKYRIV